MKLKSRIYNLRLKNQSILIDLAYHMGINYSAPSGYLIYGILVP